MSGSKVETPRTAVLIGSSRGIGRNTINFVPAGNWTSPSRAI